MENELITIFDEQRQRIGVGTRAEVHAKGYWHETFHCWFVSVEYGKLYLLFQRRSAQKKEYPNQLDITAAGHLLATETVADGVRELEEELGIKLRFQDLTEIGIIKGMNIIRDASSRIIIDDREFCHVFLYYLQSPIENLVLQEEEVAGIIKVEIQDFERLIDQECQHIIGYRYEFHVDGERCWQQEILKRDDFCPHSQSYYQQVIYAARSIFAQ
ncbi:NUDIX hydrolase [Tengunoibacter tsumagoiensis]|uniref:Putative Nudix hydrolase n=1 Tax=Tengunoibacter tsumagoiensis TaxID=2014871 RepID=A0A402A0J5_9CHLR|nr:NUDIX domain-containing protein [Tengunoibacter tsumagoiensis]GCE12605.1 putative Nudix hydrolase [Tengunoibacter tsumagoiensis]